MHIDLKYLYSVCIWGGGQYHTQFGFSIFSHLSAVSGKSYINDVHHFNFLILISFIRIWDYCLCHEGKTCQWLKQLCIALRLECHPRFMRRAFIKCK